MPPSALLLNTVPPVSNPHTKLQFHTKPTHHHLQIKPSSVRFQCKVSPPFSTAIADDDLYELLGVDSNADQSQIKRAYRELQKRCHPDIAGPTGHDMAILLNEVYSVLSDPSSRSAYDQEQAKLSQLRGYTGRPIYSTWFGSESEERAVFVDEVKCVGCLKCALFASNTFAIESVYGRARAVAQWADPEETILEAIQTCPVDCISIVERSELAALEFLMSKQPRGNVRMTAGNTVGDRVSNIFVDVRKFQNRFHEMTSKASERKSKVSHSERESRFSAMQRIRSISNWWFQHSATSAAPTRGISLSLTRIARKESEPNTERLREAAAKRKENRSTRGLFNHPIGEEYWILPQPQSTCSNSTRPWEPTPRAMSEETQKVRTVVADDRKLSTVNLVIPAIMAAVSSATVGLERGEMVNSAGLKEHIGGARILEVVNSFELQVLLAGLTWFAIGTIIAGLVEVIRSTGGKGVFRK